MSQNPNSELGRREGDRVLLIFFFSVFFSILILLFRIRLSFSLIEYPWLFPDSFDWIWNAFSYAQNRVFDVSHRGMLFSLLGAAAFRLGLEDYLTVVGTLSYALLVVSFAGLASKLFGGQIGISAALLLASSSNLIEQSAYVGCDVLALTFLNLAVLGQVLFLKTHELKWGSLALFSLVLCFHSQYIALILAPVFLICFFLSFSPNEGGLTLVHLRFVLQNHRKTLPILAAALLLFSLFFAPRWSYHHLLYTEKVQHGSLLKPDFNFTYYGLGIVSCLSWPLVCFSVLGIVSGLRQTALRPLSVVLLLWILNVFCFFAILYSWLDIRFLVYLFPPFFLFASLGIEELLHWKPFRGFSSKTRRMASLVLIVILALGTQVRSANSPFENVFYLTPSLSFEVTQQGKVVEKKRSLNFPLVEELTFAGVQHRAIDSTDFEDVRLSEPMIRLFASLKRNRAIRDLPFVVFDRSSGADIYILRNRNRLYARSEVTTISGADGILKLSQDGPIVLIFRESEIENLRRELGREKLLSRRLIEEPGWISGIFVQSR